MSKFSSEILCSILDQYKFENFKDMRKILLICKLFYFHTQKLFVKIIVKRDEFNKNTGVTLIYEDKKFTKEIKISELRYYNVRSILYNWKALDLTKRSLGNGYYKYFCINEMHYIVYKNLLYQRYFKF